MAKPKAERIYPRPMSAIAIPNAIIEGTIISPKIITGIFENTKYTTIVPKNIAIAPPFRIGVFDVAITAIKRTEIAVHVIGESICVAVPLSPARKKERKNWKIIMPRIIFELVIFHQLAVVG
jgi:hypothetical protein